MSLTTVDIPQADLLWDVARVPEAIARGRALPDSIGEYIGTKGQRQGNYYTQAARIIGLVEPGDPGEPAVLTPFGRAFVRYNRVEQRTALRRQMFRYEPMRSVLAAMREGGGLTRREVGRTLQQLAPLAESTAFRRAATVAAWICEVGLAEWRDDARLHYCGPALPLGPAPSVPPPASPAHL